jgi:mRNA-degrading endonuclease toxin of MazEF toxin-antitoxin module
VPAYLQGTLVWATMLDPQGGNPKCRPAVILNDGHKPGEQLVVAAVTTTFANPPPTNMVELPCDSATKLKYRSAVVCDWLVVLDEADIVSIGGRISRPLMEKVLNALPKRANPP